MRSSIGLVSGAQGGNDQFTKILLHMDGSNGGTSFVDSAAAGSGNTWTATTATTSTSAPKFGTANFNTNSGGYISAPDSADFTLGSNDFTFDFWAKTAGTANTFYLFGQSDSSNNVSSWSVNLAIGILGIPTAALRQTSSTVVASGPSGASIANSAWHHVAVVRSGSTITVYVDGVGGTPVSITGAVLDSSQPFSIGRNGNYSSFQFNGEIDEFRLSVGIARWTSNFTPPTIPYF